ncbi:MAG TPA: hypothetical protein VFW71_11875 [Actinomycetota bacterium]|nr:hypothetical protein [Actinomycetota bacterium]
MGKVGTRARDWAATAVGVLCCVVLLATPALAFTVAPPGATVQAGNDVTAALGGLPLAADGGPACLEVANPTTTPSPSVSFSPACSGSAGWSSTMTIITIPATPAATYQIQIDVCAAPGCVLHTTAGNIGNGTPVQSQMFTLTVTPGLPVSGTTPTPTPSPSPPPALSPVRTTAAPARTATPTKPATITAPPPPATPVAVPTPTPSPSPSPSPSTQAAGQAGVLTLDRAEVAPGGSVAVSGTGCTPGSAVSVTLASKVTSTATADATGQFRANLKAPSSIKDGRYQVVARCGPTLSTVIDVGSSSHALLYVIVVVVLLAIVFVLGLLAERSRGRA